GRRSVTVESPPTAGAGRTTAPPRHHPPARENMSNVGITRRQFVQGAAAAAAAPLVVPSSVLGAPGKPAPSERLTLGFIGVGMMNRGHLGHFLGQKDVQVLAVCDVDTKRREHARKIVEDRYGKENRGGTYKGCDAYNDF